MALGPEEKTTRRRFIGGVGGAFAAVGLADGVAWADPAAKPPAGPQPVDEIDPFIGALTTSADSACGKTFPGAVLPFGLVQLSPDTVSGGDNGSGYSADMTTIEGFSFTHLGGVGCYGDLGNLQVMPQTGNLITGRDAAKSPFRKETETAGAGRYAVELDRYRVRTELTAAQRAGMLRFTFHDAGTGRVKVDLSRRVGFDGSHSVAQFVRVTDAHTVEGWMRCDPSGGGWICGNGPTYTVYFSMAFQRPVGSVSSWDGTDVLAGTTQRTTTSADAGFFVEFPVKAGEKVLVKTGISFTSMEAARANLKRDLPDWDFDAATASARAAWGEAVGKIAVDGGTPAQRQIFYTALYHSMIDPRAIDDAGAKGKPGPGQFTRRTVFSGWDVFRAQFPLLTIIDEQVVSDQVNNLLALTESGRVRGLARWELLGTDTNTMVGDPAINIIAEAYLKGIRGFDTEKAYQLCRTVALGPAEESNRNDFTNWSTLGYCVDTSISTTLENSYSDYALARFAERAGHAADAKALDATAQNYRNLFNPTAGWFRGRNADGSWMADDAGCIESNPEQQGWFVPHDVQGLIDLVGGRDAFVQRLNAIFERTPPADMMKWNANYNHSNEPVHQMAFMFTYAGAPWLTQKWSRYVCDNAYGTGPAGLAGNDDCGQMSAWYVLASAGLYPVAPASGVYILGSPTFPRIAFHTSRGTTFTVRTTGSGIYVQSADLNNKPVKRAWITHAEVVAGGTLTLKMGEEPNQAWGSDPSLAPPSQSTPAAR